MHKNLQKHNLLIDKPNQKSNRLIGILLIGYLKYIV